jgi:hypothetical protein
MSQVVLPRFATQNAQGAKDLDYAFVIAGWPVIYTVAKNSYTPAGALSPWASFTNPIQAWANIPDAVGGNPKGRPEEGTCTIGQVDIDVLDRVYQGTRALSDLLSRQSYVIGAQQQIPITLASPLTGSSTSVNVTDANGIATGSLIYVGLECIKVGTKVQRTYPDTSWDLNGCARGYLLTSSTPHPGPGPTPGLPGARIYSFMPSLFRRRCYVYKGYQNLAMDQWAPAFGGMIGGVAKHGAKVTFSLFDATWLAYANGKQVIVGGAGSNPSTGPSTVLPPPILSQPGMIANGVGAADYTVSVNTDNVGNLGNGHYLLNIGGHWVAVTSVS